MGKRCFRRFRFAIQLLKKGIVIPLKAKVANLARLIYKNSIKNPCLKTACIPTHLLGNPCDFTILFYQE